VEDRHKRVRCSLLCEKTTGRSIDLRRASTLVSVDTIPDTPLSATAAAAATGAVFYPVDQFSLLLSLVLTAGSCGTAGVRRKLGIRVSFIYLFFIHSSRPLTYSVESCTKVGASDWWVTRSKRTFSEVGNNAWNICNQEYIHWCDPRHPVWSLLVAMAFSNDWLHV